MKTRVEYKELLIAEADSKRRIPWYIHWFCQHKEQTGRYWEDDHYSDINSYECARCGGWFRLRGRGDFKRAMNEMNYYSLGIGKRPERQKEKDRP